MFAIVIIIYAVIGFIEIYPLIKNNQKKELALYSVLFSAACIISLLLSIGIKIPSPAKFIEAVIKSVFGK